MKEELLKSLLWEKCLKGSYQLRLGDQVPKVLFTTGLSPEFIAEIHSIIPIKLIVSVYSNSSYYRKNYRIMVLLGL